MFEVGKSYDFELIDDGVDEHGNLLVSTHKGGVVVEAQMPLLKVNFSGRFQIINCHSPSFFRAIPRH